MKRDKNTIVIDRSKWNCGGDIGPSSHGEGPTFLVNNEGYMCCLGFATHQILRCKKSDLLHMPFPSAIMNKGKLLAIEYNAMQVNDNPDLSDKERESQIKGIFKRVGLKVKFKGKYNN